MNTLIYAAKNKDTDVLLHSSSGGLFSALTEDFISDGNSVLCVNYNYESDQAEFHLIDNLDDRNTSRGSLYIQSIIGDSWKCAATWLKNNKNKRLMFFGVGCQAIAFIRYAELNGFRDQVIVIDTICHGAPSPKVWKRYIDSIKQGGILSDVNFRDKKTGWAHSVGTAKIDGKAVSIQGYRKLYSSCNFLRPCCAKCPYTKIERETDLTIGDFWHIEKSMPDFVDERGVSLVLIHTEEGLNLFNHAQKYLECQKSNAQDCWQMNLEKPTEHANSRKDFWEDFKNKDVDYLVKKYGETTIMKRILRKTKRILRGGTN